MAYDTACTAAKKSCRRLLVYSSPYIMADGVPLGRSFMEAGGAYNTEILCRNAPVISKFR